MIERSSARRFRSSGTCACSGPSPCIHTWNITRLGSLGQPTKLVGIVQVPWPRTSTSPGRSEGTVSWGQSAGDGASVHTCRSWPKPELPSRVWTWSGVPFFTPPMNRYTQPARKGQPPTAATATGRSGTRSPVVLGLHAPVARLRRDGVLGLAVLVRRDRSPVVHALQTRDRVGDVQ